MSISCILLSAGESRRFGSPKPLARIESTTAIGYLLGTLLQTKISEIIVVLGADAAAIRPHIPRDRRIKIVLNENFALGQTSSFQAGLASLAAASQAVFLLPADTPFVKKETLDLLFETFAKAPSSIILPTHKDRKGHPPLIPRRLFQEFKDLKMDEPLFTVLRKHGSEITKVPVDDEGVLQAFNTPQELRDLLKRLSLLKPSGSSPA